MGPRNEISRQRSLSTDGNGAGAMHFCRQAYEGEYASMGFQPPDKESIANDKAEIM
jgi:hypothetical protein